MPRSSTRRRPTLCTSACQPSNPRLSARASWASRRVTSARCADPRPARPAHLGWWAASSATSAGAPRWTPRRSSLARVRSWRVGVRRQGDGAVGGGVVVVGGRVRRVVTVGHVSSCGDPASAGPGPHEDRGQARAIARCTRCLPRTGGALVRSGQILAQPPRVGTRITCPSRCDGVDAGHGRGMSEPRPPARCIPNPRPAGAASPSSPAGPPASGAPSSASSPACATTSRSWPARATACTRRPARSSSPGSAASPSPSTWPTPPPSTRRRAGRARAGPDRRVDQRRHDERPRALPRGRARRVRARHPGHLPGVSSTGPGPP